MKHSLSLPTPIAAVAKRRGNFGDAAIAIHDMLRWFASTQIRNVACLGGNLATASPISDMNPLLAACGATLTIASAARGERDVSVREFFKGYRKVDLQPDEIIVAVRVPHSAPLEFVMPFKQVPVFSHLSSSPCSQNSWLTSHFSPVFTPTLSL